MSQKRGKLSADKAAIERREWYHSMQNKMYTLHESKADSNQSYIASDENKIQQLKPSATNSIQYVYVMNNLVECINILVCFHGRGFNHGYFKTWSLLLQQQKILLIGVCLSGRMNSIHHGTTNLRDIATSIGEEIYRKVSAYKNCKAIFLGHDTGSLIAYEVAKLFKSRDDLMDIIALFVGGCPSPLIISEKNFKNKNSLPKLSDPEIIHSLIEKQLLHPYISGNIRMMKHFLPLIKQDEELLNNYIMDHPDLNNDSKTTDDDTIDLFLRPSSYQPNKEKNFIEIYNRFRLNIPIIVMYCSSGLPSEKMNYKDMESWNKITSNTCEMNSYEIGNNDNFLIIKENNLSILNLIIQKFS